MRKTTSTSLLLAVAAFVALTGTVSAAPTFPTFPAPDGGSSALLVAVACAGIAVARRVVGKSK